MYTQLVLYLLFCNLCLASKAAPHAFIDNGTILGIHSREFNQDFFLGIPYAAPPVGSLRYRNPKKLEIATTVNATEYGNTCWGFGNVAEVADHMDEDCLNLNIIRPANAVNLPVAVWFYGRGWNGGSRDPSYNMSYLVRNSVEMGEPIIGISLNWRATGLGFLSSTEILGADVANLGLKDQRLALEWIQDNIEAFGGNPEKVTIFGASSGGEFVGRQVTAFGGKGKPPFSAAVMEEGNALAYAPVLGVDYLQPLYDNLTKQLNCYDTSDSLDCLRSVPISDLINAFNISLVTFNGVWSNPVPDGNIMPAYSSHLINEGRFYHLPIMIGASNDEGTVFTAPGINTTAEFRDFIAGKNNWYHFKNYLRPDQIDDLVVAYPDDPPNDTPMFTGEERFAENGFMWKRSTAYSSDLLIIAGKRMICEAWAARGLPAYCYRFGTSLDDLYLNSSYGVVHYSEVSFIFDIPDIIDPYQPPKIIYEFAKKVSRTWITFFNSHDPTAGVSAGGLKWPTYTINSTERGSVAKNYVFDAYQGNSIELDDFRAEGMKTIQKYALSIPR